MDEALKLAPRQRVTESVITRAIAHASDHSYRQSAGLLENAVSHATIHAAVQRLGKAFLREVEARRHQVFSLGRGLGTVGRKVKALFCEADGVIIRVQRQSKRLVEPKLAIIHEAWERLHPSSPS